MTESESVCFTGQRMASVCTIRMDEVQSDELCWHQSKSVLHL